MASICRKVGTMADTKIGGKTHGVPGAKSPVPPVTMEHDEKMPSARRGGQKMVTLQRQLAFAAVAGRLLDPL